MIDEIITLIILYYIFKFVYRFISKEEEKKREAGSQHHMPPARPGHFPSSKTETGRPPSGRDLPKTWGEIGQILRDLKREAGEIQRGSKIPQQNPVPPHQEVAVTQHTKRIKDAQKERAFMKKKVIRHKRLTEEKTPPVQAKIIRKDKIEGAEMSFVPFDPSGLLIQGIILSEILRPPVTRRNHFLLPYMRG